MSLVKDARESLARDVVDALQHKMMHLDNRISALVQAVSDQIIEADQVAVRYTQGQVVRAKLSGVSSLLSIIVDFEDELGDLVDELQEEIDDDYE